MNLAMAWPADWPEAFRDWLANQHPPIGALLHSHTDGWSHTVYEFESNWLVRVAKPHLRALPSKHPGLWQECQLLHTIGGSLAGLKLPEPRVYEELPPTSDFSAMLYQKVAGVSAPWPSKPAKILTALAPALAQLHQTEPVPGLQALPLSPFATLSIQQDLIPAAADKLDRNTLAQVLGSLWRSSEGHASQDWPWHPDSFANVRPVLCHGDLGPANLLYHPEYPESLCGLIDFADAGFGDPLQDFAVLARRLSTAELQHWLAQYRIEIGEPRWHALNPDTLPQRLRLQMLCKALLIIWYAKRYQLAEDLSSTFTWLQHQLAAPLPHQISACT